MSSTDVTIGGVKMTLGAAGSVEECRVDVAADLARVRSGLTAGELLAECLDGVEPDDQVRRRDWRDYVDAVVAVASRTSDTHIIATDADVATIESAAYNDAAREMARLGIRLTHAQADTIGDVGCDWLRNRLGLSIETDDRGIIASPASPTS